MKKILIVVTSNNVKGATGQPTGYYLSEVSHAWDVFVKNGYEVDFVSPKGGEAPGEGLDFSDPVNKAFWDNEASHYKIQHTLKPSEVKPEDYAAIYYAGGHGTMWDLADNKELQEICRRIYENNGVVSAVCHGPVGLLNVKLSNGEYLIEGKKVNTFTDAEEKAVKLDKVVPYLLESEIKKRGVVYESSDLWQAHVAVDDRLVTGQNPASARGVGETVVKLLK